MSQAEARHCPDCGLAYAPAQLACPGCGALSHRDELKALWASSLAAEARQDWAGALLPLRQAQGLLPPDSVQWRRMAERLRGLSPKVEAQPLRRPATRPDAPQVQRPYVPWGKRLRNIGRVALGVGALAFKFKAAILALLGKGKYLLLGLQDAAPMLSLLGSFGVYWTAYGWKLAAAFLGALYIHELGHVAALKRYGFEASAPMFIPGLGAFVRMKQHPATAVENARVGLAGPLWGLGATLALGLAWTLTQQPFFGAVAYLSAVINLFNLLPVPPLDGGRALSSLDEGECLGVALACGALAFGLDSLLMGGIAMIALLRAGGDGLSLHGDRSGALRFVGLAAALGFLMHHLDLAGLAKGGL